MKYLSHVLETKGLLHSFERSAQILRRYTFGRRRFAEMMSHLQRHSWSDVRVTFCITASLLESHKEFLRSFKENGHEYAAHGFFHTNMKKKSREEQFEIVRRSYEIFNDSGMPVHGFRCPYLSYNTNTIEALARSPFSWTSNNVIFWDSGLPKDRHSEEHLKKLSTLYSFRDSSQTMSLPKYVERLLDIPLTAPDDEMIYERFRIKDSGAIAPIWIKTFQKVYERGEIYHLLFHPERFQYVSEAMKELVEETRRMTPHVWHATLIQITRWWEKRRQIRWLYEKQNSRAFRLIIQAPPESTILVKSERPDGDRFFYGTYKKADPAIKEKGLFALNVSNLGKNTVTISDKSSKSLEDFLKDEGFLVERRQKADNGSLFIGGYESFTEADKLPLLKKIDESPFPLLRVWRWPNGARCAFTISSDVDSINVGDFMRRMMNF